MRQSNGCSTFDPRSSAAKQWFEQLAQKKKKKGASTQNKRFSYYMFEITLLFLLLIDSVQQIARYYRKGICPVWAKHTLLA